MKDLVETLGLVFVLMLIFAWLMNDWEMISNLWAHVLNVISQIGEAWRSGLSQ